MTGNANRKAIRRRQALSGRIIALLHRTEKQGRLPLVEKILETVINDKGFRDRIIEAQGAANPDKAIRAEIKGFFGAGVI